MKSMHFAKALLLVGAGMLALASARLSAQEYPNRPIRIVNGLAGGPVDIQSRMVARELEARLKQKVLVEAKVGAGGLIAHREIARSKPDGYTLLFATAQLAGGIVSSKDPQYKLEDFVYLAPVSISGLAMMVSSSVPVNSVHEFIEYAKTNPGQLNYASLGAGGTPMLAAERLKHAGNFEMTHIAYRGSPQAHQEVLAGRAHVYFSGAGNAKVGMQASAGRIKILAIASASRSKFLPDVPTFKELGYPVMTSTWNIMAGPAGMPRSITQRLRDALAEILASAEIERDLEKVGVDPWRLSLDQLEAFIKADVEQTKADFTRLKIPLE